MSIPANAPITLPLFERVVLNVPEYFVLPSKKQGQFKLVKGLTASGKNFTTRQGHKSVKIKQNEKNELYLEEPNYNNPRIEYGMFNKSDQKKLDKYFAPPKVAVAETQSVVSAMTKGTANAKYHYEYVNGKKRRVLNENLINDIEYEAKEAKKRRRKASKPPQ